MDLQTFIRESLVQIVRGIEQAEASLTTSTAIVNPRRVIPGSTSMPEVYGLHETRTDGGGRYPIVQRVEFDVAVTVSASAESQGGAGLFVGAIGIGGRASSDSASSSESRIKFAIPMVLPSAR